MKTWPHPRVFVGAAAGAVALAVLLFSLDLLKAAPIALLAFVLLCVLAVIATTVYDVERATERTRAAGELVAVATKDDA